jgi:hypothetical protein
MKMMLRYLLNIRIYTGWYGSRRSIHNFLRLQEVLEDDDFLQLSSARRLVDISGMVTYRGGLDKPVWIKGHHYPGGKN